MAVFSGHRPPTGAGSVFAEQHPPSVQFVPARILSRHRHHRGHPVAVCEYRNSTGALGTHHQAAHRHHAAEQLVVRAVNEGTGGQGGYQDDEDYPAEIPTKFELMQRPDRQKPLVRVRLSVHYRVHSRQMLCIGGSQIPLGWSFLSIAKVPMTWNSGDIWTCEVDLQAGQWIEYKYVILEEQDWTKLENEDAQGLVEITYRTGDQPGRPPDVQVIQKQMAIVAWQPGPNRTLKVPTEAELRELAPGQVIERIPPRPGQRIAGTEEGTGRRSTPPPPPGLPPKPDPFGGTWEILNLDKDGKPFLDRHDVWNWSMPRPGGSSGGSSSGGSGGSGLGGGSSGNSSNAGRRGGGFNLG